MIEEAKAIADRLNSPSDWAVVGLASVAGAAVDGAINILPMPFFSPGVCALLAAGGSLSLKRAAEATLDAKRANNRKRKLLKEGERCLEWLERTGRDAEAEDLRWEIDLVRDNLQELEKLIRDARRETKGLSLENLTNQGALREQVLRGWFESMANEKRP